MAVSVIGRQRRRLLGLPNATVPYGPSKAAMINLTELLYSDLHAKNINVCHLINPGFVSTELTAKISFLCLQS